GPVAAVAGLQGDGEEVLQVGGRAGVAQPRAGHAQDLLDRLHRRVVAVGDAVGVALLGVGRHHDAAVVGVGAAEGRLIPDDEDGAAGLVLSGGHDLGNLGRQPLVLLEVLLADVRAAVAGVELLARVVVVWNDEAERRSGAGVEVRGQFGVRTLVGLAVGRVVGEVGKVQRGVVVLGVALDVVHVDWAGGPVPRQVLVVGLPADVVLLQQRREVVRRIARAGAREAGAAGDVEVGAGLEADVVGQAGVGDLTGGGRV